MGRISFILSIGLHVTLLVLAIAGLPFGETRDFEIPPAPIVVDYVEIGAVTETNIVSKNNSPKPKMELNEEAPPPLPGEKAKPKKAEVNKSNEVKVPTPKPRIRMPEKKVAKPKTDGKVYDENVLPEKDDGGKEVKDSKDAKALADASQNTQEEFSSVLKNLMDDENDEGTFVGKQGINAPLGDKMTISEQDALRSQMERCWNVPFGAKGVEDMIVEVEVIVNPDRTVRTAKILNKARYNSDQFFRAVADSALRAVKSPMCSPLELPEDKYDLWKQTIVRFNPKDMF